MLHANILFHEACQHFMKIMLAVALQLVTLCICRSRIYSYLLPTFISVGIPRCQNICTIFIRIHMCNCSRLQCVHEEMATIRNGNGLGLQIMKKFSFFKSKNEKKMKYRYPNIFIAVEKKNQNKQCKITFLMKIKTIHTH